ncbi:putative RNA polymerase II subunit B1 CTD phosphatase RPAP2 [Babylonia areolata]|uniref:putative RNA polymerase II subunit B1 CTD phosphatase RPAP2 n=1 Tax=Babylonia areolata TaxID=304850 RepID=UPI003FD21696
MGRSKDQSNGGSKSASKKTKSRTKSADKDEKKAAEHQRKAEMETKIRDRVASEARAFDVVNRLIEPNITAEYLLQACQFIDHSHYEDVVEERSISRLCGYPVCSNALRQVAKQKYHISTRSNTVFDITERKKFCSNRCYTASEHLRKQIPQTPVWTRRGASMDPFDLLHHDVSGCGEGEEVIGSRMIGLRDELLLLKKLDHADEKAARTQKLQSAEHGRTSVEESKQLSDELLSLSTEEELDRGMEKLSLTESDGDKVTSAVTENYRSTGDAYGDRSMDVERGGQRQEEAAAIRRNGDTQKLSGDKLESVQGDHLGLESSMKDLTLQDSGDLNGADVDSDDDCAGSGGNVGVSKDCMCERKGSAVSKTHTALLRTGAADSDDDEEQETNVQNCTISAERGDSAGKLTESGSLSKPGDPVVSETCTNGPQPVEPDSKAGTGHALAYTFQVDEKPEGNSLKQQPGESKPAYLLRLLDRRRNLLSKVADIQSDFSDHPKKSESKTICSAGSSEIESKEDEAKPPVSERRQGSEKENKPDGSASEKLKQEEKSRLGPGENHPPRKKKSIQAVKNSSLQTAPQAEVSPLSSICQVISTWISAETLDYLGLTSAQTEGCKADENDSTSMFHKDPEMRRKYEDLCLRLAGQEKDFDDVLGEEEVEEKGDKRGGGKRPLPNYGELKKQTDEYQLKVHSFLGGSTTVKSKATKAKSDGGDGDKLDSERPVVLPDIDSHNQQLIRRRIVLERLDRTMPSLLPPLGLSVQDISASLRELVFTFSLTSHNIIFKPVEWTLAAIILLKMVESKSVAVSRAFQSVDRCSAFNMVLSRLNHSSASVGQLVQDMLAQSKQRLQGQGS